MKKVFFVVFVILFITVNLAKAENGKFSGYMFGDYYYILGNHNEDFEKSNGFWLRRVYFTYDQSLSKTISFRLRLEMATPDGLTKNADIATPFLKDAYLKWKTGRQQLLLGISGTPTWEVIEKTWGYRAVEKTPLDLQKFGSSRDFGLALKGNLDKAGKFKYHLMLGNGNSNKSENDTGKKVMFSLGFYPTKSIIIEVYGDWNDRPDSTDWTTLQAFAAYQTENARFGLQYAHQTRNGETDTKLRLASLFAVFNLAKKVSVFGRIDRMFDPNPGGDGISYIPFSPDANSTFIVAGVDFKVHKNVNIIPNLEFVFYDNPVEGAEKPSSDVFFRITFWWRF